MSNTYAEDARLDREAECEEFEQWCDTLDEQRRWFDSVLREARAWDECHPEFWPDKEEEGDV